MGEGSVGRVLMATAIPLILSMLVQALYNMVDSFYVSMLSQDAFNAVSLSFPIQNIMIAVASGTGTGVVTLASRSLGERNPRKAGRYAAAGIFLAFASFLVFFLFGISGAPELFFRSQTDIPAIIEGGSEYLRICTCLSFGAFGQVILERLMQATGKASLSMYTQAAGAIVNILLDPVFIFGRFGAPAMGVAGAAVATVLGQITSLLLGLVLHFTKNRELSFTLADTVKPSPRFILDIYRIGVPSILTIGIGSVMTFLMNLLFMTLEPTGTAAAVFGAYFKLQSFVFMPVIGLSHAMNPIVSYNMGAMQKERMMKTYRTAILIAMGMMTLGAILFIGIPGLLLDIFSASAAMKAIGIPAFRVIGLTFFIAGYTIITSNFFMACGRSLISLCMSVVRQLVLLVPAAYLLGYLFGYQAAFIAIPVGELGAMAIGLVGRARIQKHILDKMPDTPPAGAGGKDAAEGEAVASRGDAFSEGEAVAPESEPPAEGEKTPIEV